MTTRALWQSIMHYGEFDRVPVIHWCGWPETRERWIAEGLPPDVNEHEYFGAVPMWAGVGVDLDLFPKFEEETLEDTDEYRIFRDAYGVVQQDWKHRSCIPHYTDFTLKTAAEWPEYKKRLQPDPRRVPEDLDKRITDAESSGLPIVISTASLMGWIRNWMGVVNLSYLGCEDPDCFADMVNTIADLVCWGFDQVIPRMDTGPDLGFGWEDICGKTGPLVSPDIFRRCVAPTVGSAEFKPLATLFYPDGKPYGHGIATIRYTAGRFAPARMIYVWMRMWDVTDRHKLLQQILNLAADMKP